MKTNLKGCKPTEDVCMKHEEPLLCRHGCGQALEHKCSDELPLGEQETRSWKLSNNHQQRDE